MRKATLKAFNSAIKPYGLYVSQSEGKHYAIVNDSGKRVATLSSTGDPNACRQAIRDLVRAGLVPSAVKRLKFS